MSLFQTRVHDARDMSLVSFPTYEDYLDSQITAKDRQYLDSDDLARQLVELGYRGHGYTLKREEFIQKKREALDLDNKPVEKTAQMNLTGSGKDLRQYPFLEALAAREQDILNGKLTSIIFVRDKNSKGQEISGYIDYTQRLKTDDFEQYFLRKKRFLPRSTDLSFYNWDTQSTASTSSANFQVIAESSSGILFKNKRDRKIVNVDPRAQCGDNSTRTVIKSDEYIQIVIYDHLTRRKAE